MPEGAARAVDERLSTLLLSYGPSVLKHHMLGTCAWMCTTGTDVMGDTNTFLLDFRSTPQGSSQMLIYIREKTYAWEGEQGRNCKGRPCPWEEVASVPVGVTRMHTFTDEGTGS